MLAASPSPRVDAQPTVLYLGVYMLMNLAAFAVIVIRERETASATTSPPSRGSASSVPCWRWR